MTLPHARPTPWRRLAIYVACVLIVDVLAVVVAQEDASWSRFLLVCFFHPQFALIGLYAALGPGSFMTRFPLSLLATTILARLVNVAFFPVIGSEHGAPTLTYLAALSGVLGEYVCFRALRADASWALVFDGFCITGPYGNAAQRWRLQFSLRELLFATTVAAFALGIMDLSFFRHNDWFSRDFVSSMITLVGWFFVGIVPAGLAAYCARLLMQPHGDVKHAIWKLLRRDAQFSALVAAVLSAIAFAAAPLHVKWQVVWWGPFVFVCMMLLICLPFILFFVPLRLIGMRLCKDPRHRIQRAADRRQMKDFRLECLRSRETEL